MRALFILFVFCFGLVKANAQVELVLQRGLQYEAHAADLSPNDRYLAMASDKHNESTILIYDLKQNMILRRLLGHTKDIDDVVFCSDDRLLSCSEDGTVKVWNVKTGKEIWSVSFTATGDYIIASRSGYYMTTPGAFDAIGFLRNGKVLPPASFDLIYHRPDSVLRMIGNAELRTLEAMEKAWTRRVERSGFQVSDLSTGNWVIPEMIVTSELSAIQSTRELSLGFKASTEEGQLQSWQVYINGCPQFGSRGHPLTNIRSIELSTDLVLSRGMNIIHFECLNDLGFKSVSNPLVVDFQSNVESTNIHILTAAVSEYRDSIYDLTYPQKDASDLLQAKWEDKFDNVDRTQLHGSKFSRYAFLEQLSDLKNTDPDDVVVIFLAGHGLLDDEFEFYFATYDCDFDNPAKYGLSYEELDSMLYLIPSRKVLLMIDACHSGEVDVDLMKTESIVSTNTDQSVSVGSQFRGAKVCSSPQVGLRNSMDYMKQLFVSMNYGTSAQVISAASGEGYALESDKWNNGLFTYAFLNALQDSDADLNRNRKLEVSELRTYVSEKVEDLSNGKQIPTARAVNRSDDFVVH